MNVFYALFIKSYIFYIISSKLFNFYECAEQDLLYTHLCIGYYCTHVVASSNSSKIFIGLRFEICRDYWFSKTNLNSLKTRLKRKKTTSLVYVFHTYLYYNNYTRIQRDPIGRLNSKYPFSGYFINSWINP